jgi:hypothetical protein
MKAVKAAAAMPSGGKEQKSLLIGEDCRMKITE